MAEYITRSAAIAVADYAADEHPYEKLGGASCSEYNEGWNDACDYIREKLENEPAADVAPVVRCKDCLWRGREECAVFYRCDCGEQHTWETDNDFCSYGERKEPDDEQPNRNR